MCLARTSGQTKPAEDGLEPGSFPWAIVLWQVALQARLLKSEIYIQFGCAHPKKNQVVGEAVGDVSSRVKRDLWAFSFGLI